MQAQTNHNSWKEIPVHPWSKLATDIFHFEGASYLSIVDYTNRFPIVHTLTSMTCIYVANQYFLNMDGLTLSYLTMVYVIHKWFASIQH